MIQGVDLLAGGGEARPHVRFAVPSYSGKFAPEFARSLESTADLLDASGWRSSLEIMAGDCYIQAARNKLVASFMRSDADALFFLDDDIGFPAEAVLRLLRMPDDVVFGVYPLKRDEPGYPVVIYTDPNGYPSVRADGCIDAVGAPGGFLRIKRGAIETLHASYPERRYMNHDDHGRPTPECYDLFPQGVRNGRWFGEDLGFSHLCLCAGLRLWCVPDIDFSHEDRKSGKVYRGNYHRYLIKQPRHDAAA